MSHTALYHGWGIDLTEVLAHFTNPTTRKLLPTTIAAFYADHELLPQSFRTGWNTVQFPEDPQHHQNYALIPDISPVLNHTQGLQVYSHHQAIQLLVQALNQTLFNRLSVYELKAAQSAHDAEAWAEINGNMTGALETYLEANAGPVDYFIHED